ncbi:MAG: hypothetical protein IJ477_06395 [Alistipes sp.]|nr:hypothetical protein [Alistipes sp.]
MKRLMLILVAAMLGACNSDFFTETAPEGKGAPIVPMRLVAGTQHAFLTDYLPTWEGADSLTVESDQLALKALKEDWSEFEVTCPEKPLATTINAWKGGRKCSIVALAGERNTNARLFTAGQMMRMVAVESSVRPLEIVAMWQNCRLPEQCIVRGEESFEVLIPTDAAQLERSFLRIFAVSSEGLFNDVLIPLSGGSVVTSTDELTRHDHEAQILYSLMIDRFKDGKAENNKPLNRTDVLPQADYQGGDLKGITQKIREGFFTDLGMTTIWISPITQNPEDAWGLNQKPYTRFSGYHGYWPIYTTVVDHRFGTEEELHEMLATAHEHNLNVVLDYVANHLHINSPVLQEHPDWVTPLMLPDGRKNLGLWDEQRLTTWFDEHIPTLDHERPEVVEPMTDSAVYWMNKFDFDGFRHDACKHIPLNYWRTLTKKMRRAVPDKNLWQIGETYGSPELIGSYVKTGMINAQFDFNVYHTALDVLTRGHSVKALAQVVDQSIAAYGAHHTMGNITGNHDKGRLISLAGGTLDPDEDHKLAGWTRKIEVGNPVGYKKLALVNALNMTIPGVPCIYQGDEYGEPGGNDPDNRRMMRFEGYNEAEQAQLALTKQLTELRRSEMPLLYGDQMTLLLTEKVWVYLRVYMGQWVVVALNTGDEDASVECVLPSGIDMKQSLKANFGHTFELTPDGRLMINLAGNEFEILTKN